MKKIQWKGRLKVLPTLRCNAKCPYCNNVCPDKVNYASIKEADLNAYKKFVNLVDVDQVILSGGEPTLHRQFLEIVDLCCSVYSDTVIYSNGKKFGIDKILQTNKNKVHICLSYHPTEMNKEEFLEGYIKLINAGYRFYWIASVEDRYRLAQLVSDVDWLKSSGIKNISIVNNWYYDKLDKCVSGRKYMVKCYLPDEPLVSPDLRVYMCTSRMLAQDKKYSFDIIKGEPLPKVMKCDFAGWCTMCDRNHRKEEI